MELKLHLNVVLIMLINSNRFPAMKAQKDRKYFLWT